MSIERVCVVGGGVIGSLYAAHLSRVADVDVDALGRRVGPKGLGVVATRPGDQEQAQGDEQGGDRTQAAHLPDRL